jgi:hypothetical protein
MSNLKLFLFCFGVFLASVTWLYNQNSMYFKMESVYKEVPDVDELDYHFIAANFALHNEFPVIGFISKESDYNLSYKKNSAVGYDKVYLDMFRLAGPVNTVIRPPLYPLLVGLAYKIFGIHLSVLLWVNILLLSITTGLLPLIALKIWKKGSLLISIAATLLFLKILDFELFKTDPDMATPLLGVLLYWLVNEVLLNPKLNFLFWLGIVAGITLLTKPLIVFLIIMLVPYFYLKLGYSSKFLFIKNLVIIVLGMAIFIIPGSVYLGLKKQKTENARKMWAHKISLSVEEPTQFNSKQEIESSNENTFHAIKNFVKYIYCYNISPANGSFFAGDGFLYLNNEFCINNIADNGTFGWLWKVVKTSYYNTIHKDANGIEKVYYFYRDNPKYIYLIPYERIKMSSFQPMVFWLSIALWSLVTISKVSSLFFVRKNLIYLSLFLFFSALFFIDISFRMDLPINQEIAAFSMVGAFGLSICLLVWFKIPMDPFPLFWLNTFMFIFFIYGDQRFLKPTLAISCLMIVSSTVQLFDLLIKSIFNKNMIQSET